MNAWDNEDCGTKPGDTEPNGQKCLYHVSLKKGNCTLSGKQSIHGRPDPWTSKFNGFKINNLNFLMIIESN